METDYSNPLVFDQNQMKSSPARLAPQGDDYTKWRTLYTTYFNKDLTIKEGRRLPKEKCVENPNVNMIAMAMNELGIKGIIEPVRKHPRDYFNLGRIKVKLVNDNGEPIHKNIGTDKRKLMNAIADKFESAKEKYDQALAQQIKDAEKYKEEIEAIRSEGATEAKDSTLPKDDKAEKKKKKKGKK